MFDSAYTSTKYTFVCDPDECDTMIEITTSDKFGFPSGVVQAKCPCGRQMSYISSTIEENPTIERQHPMEETTSLVPETYNANALVTYKRIHQGETTFPTLKVNDLEWKLDQGQRSADRANELQSTINKIIDCLTEEHWFNPNTELQDVLTELCEILNHNPVKTVTFEASVTVRGEIEVPLSEWEDFDMDSHIADNLTIDSYDGNTTIDTYDVDYVTERQHGDEEGRLLACLPPLMLQSNGERCG